MQQNLSISSFKRFLAVILFPFLAACIVIGTAVNYFFEKKIILGTEISGAYKVNRIINDLHKDEIPFFGSSRCEGSFIPDSLVKNGFNYGMSGIQDDVLLFFLKEECNKVGKTTPIIINFDLDGLNYSLGDLSYYIPNAGYSAVKELLGSSYKPIYQFPLLKYYGSFELSFKYYMNNKLNLTTFSNKGATIEKNELSKQKFDESVRDRLATENIFQNDKKLLVDFLQTIETNKSRKFIIVIAPYHNSFFNKFTNYAEAEGFLNSLKRFENIVVFNFAKTVYPDNFFFNTTHLNLKGAVVFNRQLKDSLNTYINR